MCTSKYDVYRIPVLTVVSSSGRRKEEEAWTSESTALWVLLLAAATAGCASFVARLFRLKGERVDDETRELKKSLYLYNNVKQ